MPTHAVLFDFNGTLSHDEPLLCRIYRELFAEHGRPITERFYYERLAGLAERAIAEACLGAGDQRIAAFVRERIERYLAAADGSTIPARVREAVRVAGGRARLAVVSGAARVEIAHVVAAAGLDDLLGAIVADDDVAEGKPHPESYLLACARLGVAPAEALAFEDTEAGVAAARAAGTRVVAVAGTQPHDRLAAADEIVDRLDGATIRRLLA